MSEMIQMYSIPPQSHIDSAKKLSSNRSGCGHSLAIKAARTAIDCVATTAISQAPVSPFSSGGLSRLTVKAVKIV